MPKNKTVMAIALFTMLAMSAFIIYLPTASAAVIKTYIFINVAPNPVGVGQTVQILFLLDKVPPWFPNGTVSGEYWQGITISVTKPDGTTETLGPYESQSQAAGYVPYIPTKTGNYTFQAHFPGQTLTVASTNTYGASDSATVTLTVQEEQVGAYPGSPLPTEYWTRPINAQNREWATIGGNWLGLSNEWVPNSQAPNPQSNLYSIGPETAHIAWTKELAIGGLIGGNTSGSLSDMYFTGLWYYPKIVSPIIMNGILYIRTMSSPFQYKGTVAIDIRTGKELWNKDGVFATFGSIWFEEIGDIHGGIPYLWGTGQITDDGIVYAPGLYEGYATSSTWHLYDAFTGDLVRTFANVTPGTVMFGPNGEVLEYILNTAHNWLAMWNSSAVTDFIDYKTGLWQWTPTTGPAVDWRHGVDFNVTIDAIGAGYSIQGIDSGVIYASKTYTLADGDKVASDVAFDIKTGDRLWGPTNRTVTGAVSNLMVADGVAVEFDKTAYKLTAYNIKTGTMLWTNNVDAYALSNLAVTGSYAYGKLYVTTYAGYIYAFDIQTGKLTWRFYTGSSGFETPTGNWEINGKGFVIADGKIYIPTSDCEPFRPYWRGYTLICLNATTGNEIWRSLGAFQTQVPRTQGMALADGYLVGMNMYDDQLYSYGKGPTATTVMAPNTVQPLDTQILVQGTVMDQSAGTKDSDRTARFPNGVPAVSDESMSAWMEYVYQQQPKPTNATGVKVTVSVLDPNNNVYDVGTTTSDDSGFFKLTFTPPVPGQYTIIATFAGSESYYSSTAETAISISEAPAATSAPTSPPASMADLYLLPGIAGIIIAIAIVGALILLALRKR
jgi:outer membrane protein assembly factor BamB